MPPTTTASVAFASPIDIRIAPGAHARVAFGRDKLAAALTDARAFRPTIPGLAGGPTIHIAVAPPGEPGSPPAEGFTITRAGGDIHIIGGDASGAMYGCLELAELIRTRGEVAEDLRIAQSPHWPLRGPCIGMQKTFILPGRKVYEYPYTPELFPFFYDRAFWEQYLDFLARHRMNTLYLWNGWPFASLVEVDDYPYAVEVSEEILARNQSMLRYIASEADRRGIWVVQMFYSLLLPKPLADRHGLSTQLSEPNEIAADYTRKSLARFVEQYPHVGLMVCLGEALQGQENQNRWLLDVILPGIKDGIAAAGLTEQPPVVIRTHATDLRKVMPDALKLYSNIYTEAKFNGESLTTHEPRGRRQVVHQAMAALGSTHMINVHILANLEPFRYGAPRFIRKSVIAGRDRLGARGLHLYPLAYWSWPDAPDATEPPLAQIDRDWIWFEAWARYAWNPDVDEARDREYWVGRLAELYGNATAAGYILDAYNDSGECAPRLLRRFGITEGNRQTMSLGMTLDQLINPEKHRAFEELWESQSPPGERLGEYAQRAWHNQPHEGETPPRIVDEVLDYAARAVAAIEAAAPLVKTHGDEFERLRNDVHCIRLMSLNYAEKVRAAMAVLRFRYSGDPADMEAAERHLAASLEYFRALADRTAKTYRFANTMQTNQRKIPFNGGVDGKPINYHWTQLVPLYEQELAEFRARVARIRAGEPETPVVNIEPLKPLEFTLVSGGATYRPAPAAKAFTDTDIAIGHVAPEIAGLTGIRFANAPARAGVDPEIVIEVGEPAVVLIGYVVSDAEGWRRPPDLETDALAADRGAVEPYLTAGASLEFIGRVDVFSMKIPAGRQRLGVRGSGSYVILGVVSAAAPLAPRDVRSDTLPGAVRQASVGGVSR